MSQTVFIVTILVRIKTEESTSCFGAVMVYLLFLIWAIACLLIVYYCLLSSIPRQLVVRRTRKAWACVLRQAGLLSFIFYRDVLGFTADPLHPYLKT